MLWGAINFAWLCYFTYQIKGVEKTAELISHKIFIGTLPFLISIVAIILYHYLRSDLYLEKDKPSIGKSLIPGRLLRMVENWQLEPYVHIINFATEYKAYMALRSYRASYEFDSIHSQIDEFLKAFIVDDNFIMTSIKTIFKSQEEADMEFPRLKQLVKEIGRELT